MHIVQGKRLTGETCIIEHIITGTLDQFQHSQTQASPDEQATIGLANQTKISGAITYGSGRQALR